MLHATESCGSSDPQLAFVIDYSAKISRLYYNRLPYEDRAVLNADDIQQDLIGHYLEKAHKYNKRFDFKRWARTIIYNKAITICQRLWDQKHRPSYAMDSGYVTALEPDGDELTLVLVDEITPEHILEILQEDAIMADKVEVAVSKVEELCERFECAFDSEDVAGSLDSLLEYVLNDMAEEDYDAIDKETRNLLTKLGEAVENETISIVTKTKGSRGGRKAAGKKSGTGQTRSGSGPIAKINELFEKGITDVPSMIEQLAKDKVDCSDATVRTQVGKLRREAGMTTGRRGRQPSGTGILATIRTYYDDGIKTVPEMLEALKADSSIKDFSPSTVRTAVGKLRKEEGLTGTGEEEESAAARKKTSKKKTSKKKTTTAAAGNSSAGKKKTTTKKKTTRKKKT